MAKISSEQKFVDFLRQYNIPLKSINFEKSEYNFSEAEIKTIHEIYSGKASVAPSAPLPLSIPEATNKDNSNEVKIIDVENQWIEFQALEIGSYVEPEYHANTNTETVESYSFNPKNGRVPQIQLEQRDIRVTKKRFWIF